MYYLTWSLNCSFQNWLETKKKKELLKQIIWLWFRFLWQCCWSHLNQLPCWVPCAACTAKVNLFFLHLDQLPVLVASVGVQQPQQLPDGNDVECGLLLRKLCGTTFTAAFKHCCNGRGFGHPNDWVFGLLGTRERSSSWHMFINRQLWRQVPWAPCLSTLWYCLRAPATPYCLHSRHWPANETALLCNWPARFPWSLEVAPRSGAQQVARFSFIC